VKSLAEPAIAPVLPEQLSFLRRGLGNPDHWNLAGMFRVPTDLDPGVLRTALAATVHRHAALRTGIVPGPGGEPCMRVRTVVPVDLDTVDLSQVPAEARAEQVQQVCARRQESLSLSECRVFSFTRFRLTDTEARLLVVLHHIAADALSFRIVAQDVERACRQLLAGEPISYPRQVSSASAYSRWLAGFAGTDIALGALNRWLQLSRVVPRVPTGSPGIGAFTTEQTLSVRLDQRTTDKIIADRLPRIALPIPAVAAAAALTAIHGRTTGAAARIDLLSHGRIGLPRQPNIARSVGWFACKYPVALELDTTLPFTEQLARTDAALCEIPHNGISYGVLRTLCPDRGVRAALDALGDSDVLINYHGKGANRVPGMLLEEVDESAGDTSTDRGVRAYTHSIDMFVDDSQLGVAWSYSSDQFAAATIESKATCLLETLAALLLSVAD